MFENNRKSSFPHRLRMGMGIVLFLGASLAAAGSVPGQTLAPIYQKWLDEEVVYITTPMERDVFLKLQTDRDRDLFIEAFWKHRESARGGSANSFRTEHYKRIAYANRYYGRTSPLPGWKTDRGRIYIILGEPTSVQKFDNDPGLYPTEVWFYQNKESLGLPMGFNLVFFQGRGSGDYKLYSPSQDGPQALMTNYLEVSVDYARAYQALQQISPDLASVSLSPIPGDSSTFGSRPSLSFDILLKNIEESPRKLVDVIYARKFLELKDIVDVEYSANFVDSDVLVTVLKDPAGTYFVHYAVEPARMSVEQAGDRYIAILKINGTVSDSGGRRIYQFDKTAPISISAAQLKDIGQAKFDYYDMFPMIPGTYKISILVKNETSKEFTTFDRTIVIPGGTPILQMTSPILAYKIARSEDAIKRLRPFRLGTVQLYAQPIRAYARAETLAVAFQIFGLTPSQRESTRIKFVFLKDNQIFLTKERGITEYAALPDILEEFPLAGFSPAYYALNVSCVIGGRDVLTAKEDFEVSYQNSLPRPWFYSKFVPESSDPLYAELIGNQLFNSGRYTEAKEFLEKGYRQKPDSAEAALALARAYRVMNEDADIPAILDPFLRPPQPPNYEVFILAVESRLKLGKAAEALALLERATAQFGTNAELLNQVGEGRAALNQPKEALAAWEQSIKINPDQPDLRRKINALKEKQREQ